jgi:hypothetical protein
LSVGDQVSYVASHNGQPVVGKIIKLNAFEESTFHKKYPKRAKVHSSNGIYNVPYEMLSLKDVVTARATKQKEKNNPKLNKKELSLDEEVGFRSPKLGLVKGTIIKLNAFEESTFHKKYPKRARLKTIRGEYDVPYEMIVSLN